MLFKAIEHGKEHRKPFSSKSLRRYGLYCLSDFDHSPKRWQDPWFRDNRLYANRKAELQTHFDLISEGLNTQTSFRVKAA